jgi:hypothetical protein
MFHSCWYTKRLVFENLASGHKASLVCYELALSRKIQFLLSLRHSFLPTLVKLLLSTILYFTTSSDDECWTKMHESNRNGLYPFFQWLCMLTSVDCDFNLDLHAIWQECSGIPIPPPCLATDSDNCGQILSDAGEPAGYETSGSSLI